MEENKNNLLSKEEKDKLIDIMSKYVQDAECPMCHNHNFAISDGYFNMPISNSKSDIVIGGSIIPTIGVICTKCGFISNHALGVLGLLNENKDVKDG